MVINEIFTRVGLHQIHTLVVSPVNYLINFNQNLAVKCHLSDFLLREVIEGRVVLGAVFSKI